MGLIQEKYDELTNAINQSFEALHIEDDEEFSILKGLPLKLVHTLLLARDLKINIRT